QFAEHVGHVKTRAEHAPTIAAENSQLGSPVGAVLGDEPEPRQPDHYYSEGDQVQVRLGEATPAAAPQPVEDDHGEGENADELRQRRETAGHADAERDRPVLVTQQNV